MQKHQEEIMIKKLKSLRKSIIKQRGPLPQELPLIIEERVMLKLKPISQEYLEIKNFYQKDPSLK